MITNQSILRVGLIVVLAGSTLLGRQQPPVAAPPAGAPAAAPQGPGRGGRGGAPVRSPEVAADGRVTFRLRAASAQSVAATIGGKRLEMQKDEQGVWSVTTDPLAPDYYAHRSRGYPVLYLLHGLGDDAERWMNGGGAPAIMDNLIAQGKAVPMVVVTTLGYGVSSGPAGEFGAIVSGYTKILLTEVMPAVGTSYHVSVNREDRAIAGLSMGGAETLYTGLNNIDKFAWMGSFSGAFVMWPGGAAGRGAPGGQAPAIDASLFEKNFPALDAKINPKVRMLWIVCGTADSLIGVNRQFKTWLTSKGVQFTQDEIPDVGHVWPLWRQHLTTFRENVS